MKALHRSSQLSTANRIGGKMSTVTERPQLRSLSTQAKALGVTVACLRGWVYKRKINYVKVGASVKISDAEVEKIIAKGTVPALEDTL
jgi:hypothetical protein